MDQTRTWRDQLVNTLLVVFSGLSVPLVPAILSQIELDPASVVVTWVALAVLVAAAVFRRRVPYLGRVGILLTVCGTSLTAGLLGAGPLAGPILSGALMVLFAGLLLGRRAGFVALGVGVLSVALVGTLLSGGVVAPPASPPLDEARVWAGETLAYLLFVGILATAVFFVVTHLEQALATQEIATARLEAAQEERRTAQAALSDARQAIVEFQRVEALGRLAGGIAHDFNNALMVILGSAEVISDSSSGHPEVAQAVHEIRDAAQHAAQLTAQLLAFGRRDARAPVVLDPVDILDNTATALRRLLPEDIEVRVEVDAPPNFVADETQIRQVLLNLAINARDAMPDGGTLTMTASGTSGASPSLVFEVRDTGVGIPPALHDKVFEPFFTTKEHGHGTGLGLSTAYGIVHHSGGTLSLRSTPGEGTTFRVELPATGAPAAPAVGESPSAALATTGVVLLAEDNPLVRRAMDRSLQQAGFTTLPVEDVPTGVQTALTHPTRIDLLCTDGIMPGGSCRDLIMSFRERFPGAPVLVCSGHLQEKLLRRLVEAGSVDYLAKPFTGPELVERVCELLGRTPEPTGRAHTTS